MKRRIIAVISLLTLLVSAFAGIASAEEADESFMIGYNFFGPGAFALLTLANNSDYVITDMGDTPLAVSDNFQVEQIVADVENMCSAGCDGVLIWLPVDALFTTIGEICARYEVPFALADKFPTDPAILEELRQNPYFIGGVSSDNVAYGKGMAEYAIEKGYKTCLISTSSIGDPSDTPKIDAFREVFEAGGGEILDILYSETSTDAQAKLESSLIINNPEIIYGPGSDYGIAAVGALDTMQMTGDVSVLTSGLDLKVLDLEKEGKIELVTGDYYIAGYFTAILMEAYLRGNQLLDEDGNVPVLTNIPPFEVSMDKYDLFQAVFMDNNCYSAAETQALVSGSYEDFVQAIQDFSIENRAKAKVAEGTIDAALLEEAGISID